MGEVKQGRNSQENNPQKVLYTRVRYKHTKYRKRKHKRRRLWLSGITAIVFLLILWNGTAEMQARITPDYPKEELESTLDKQVLSEADYELLFRQTGLGPLAVDELKKEGRENAIFSMQDAFFSQLPIQCKANSIISREERVVDVSQKGELLPCLEDGDILITFNSHVLGWRNGHAALVVDAEKGLTLEARVLGTDSAIMSIKHWERYPSFAVLRLKDADGQRRAEIASYARENLVNVPYRLSAGWRDGIFSAVAQPPSLQETRAVGNLSEDDAKQVGTVVTGTHCSHLVWYAYLCFGYDLDSDGGLLVTPRDLYESEWLDTVQLYGMSVEKLE